MCVLLLLRVCSKCVALRPRACAVRSSTLTPYPPRAHTLPVTLTSHAHAPPTAPRSLSHMHAHTLTRSLPHPRSHAQHSHTRTLLPSRIRTLSLTISLTRSLPHTRTHAYALHDAHATSGPRTLSLPPHAHSLSAHTHSLTRTLTLASRARSLSRSLTRPRLTLTLTLTLTSHSPSHTLIPSIPARPLTPHSSLTHGRIRSSPVPSLSHSRSLTRARARSSAPARALAPPHAGLVHACMRRSSSISRPFGSPHPRQPSVLISND